MENRVSSPSVLSNFLSQGGLTLIEMSMALIISSIVLIGISVIVTTSYDSIKSCTNKINLQQDFSFLESFLSNNINQSGKMEFKIYKNITDLKKGKSSKESGSCLALKTAQAGWLYYYQDNLDFRIMDSKSKVTNLVHDVVEKILFTKQDNSIQTFISLSRGGNKIEGTLLNAFRN